jgi:putative transposase
MFPKKGGNMATHSKVRIYIHLLWGTYNHEPMLKKDLRLKIFDHLQQRANDLGNTIYKMNIQPDHVHIALNLLSTQTMAEVAKKLKGECSNWINENNLTHWKFKWQRGYGAYSVSASQLLIVENYIKNQEEHHRRKTFQEEYKEWAVQYGIWDDE